jgi:transketolase
LPAIALRVRAHVVRMATRGGCFVGASLSCTDLLVHLYGRVLDVSPRRTSDPDRDYLLLSKGHDVPALYGTLAEFDFIPHSRLARHLDVADDLYWHPNRNVPGVEFHSGSLGHLLGVGLGIALDLHLRDKRQRVFVVLGDGELNEGSIWEAALVAAGLGLSNLVAVVDRNGAQANAFTEDLLPLEPLADKWSAFGWGVRQADGHDFEDLERAFQGLPERAGRPTVILARTRRGQGLPSLTGRLERWFANLDADEVEALLRELHGAPQAVLRSSGTVVR